MSNNPDNEKIPANKMYPIDLAQKITIIKGAPPSDSKIPHLVTGSKLSATPGQIITHTLPLSLMRPSTQIISQGISSQAQLVSGGQTLTGTVVGTAGVANPLLQGAQIVSQGIQSGAPGSGMSGQGQGQATVRSLTGAVRVLAPLNLPTLPQTLSLPLPLPLQHGHLATPVNSPSARPISTIATPVTAVKQITTNYHVPRGPAAVASLAVPRGSATPRVSTPTPAWSTGGAQIRSGALVYAPRPPRPHTLQIATTRPAIRQVTQVNTTVVARAIRPANAPSPQRTPPPQGIQTLTPVRTAVPKVVPLGQRNYQPGKVVGVATLGLRPAIIPPRPVGGTFYYEVSSGTAGPAGQTLPIKPSLPTPTVAAIPVLSVSTSVVTQTLAPTMSTMSSISSISSMSAITSMSSMPTAHSAAQILTSVPLLTPVNSFGGTIANTSEMSRAPSSPGGPQRPSILRKRDNEGSPMKMQNIPVASPPPSPGGSTTVSATSTPEPEDDDHSTITPPPPNIISNSLNMKNMSSLPVNSNNMMASMSSQSAPMQQQNSDQSSYNNCSPRKKPRKQLLLSSEAHCGSRVGDFEFPSEGTPSNSAPSPPTTESHSNMSTNASATLTSSLQTDTATAQPDKPPKHVVQLGAGWRCGWRATALHFTRPSDVRIREEKRPSVVELASQRHVLQKANGWKLHHLTAQMDDLRELELGVFDQAAAALQVLESKPSPELDRLCELLKGNIQRSKIVGEGVAEARANVLRIFQHKGYVSDILARQADKRCFKKHRNQC